ncbi:coiled-coil domain-containing protein 14 [Stegostoma tigrinum]|uniref:coiled-coil domain-containing protein 14 n=1 Tax=Stegostoma tigrinum TaxID=3053191 RepID=UPI00202B843E|nr:coiled-coil domain-containing protein 14 [Stegostoma tigrinum]XP_048389774.1 coiled-coil domain-containing protein 14 [Stegostoma tigrinum]
MPFGCNRESTVKMKSGKASKALSSGRLVGSSKQRNGKKRFTSRKASTVDSGYSLYSTDSEDQVANIHKGLDRCAALLQDILKNETADQKVAALPSKKTNVRKAKLASNKGENSKKEVKKNGPVSCAVCLQKETASTPKLKRIPDAVEVGVNNTTHVSTMPHSTIPSSQHSPVINHCLSDHVQTQMGLINDRTPGGPSSRISPRSYYTILDSGPQVVSAFNCRLPTSTPTESPKNLEHPLVIHSSIPTELRDQPVLQKGLNFVPAYSGSDTIVPTAQPVVTFPVSAVTSAVAAHPLAQLVCNTGTGCSHCPQQVKEQELLKCIQCHTTQMHQGEVFQQVAWEAQGTDQSDTEQSDGTITEDDHINFVDITPVKDTSCQTSFDKHTKPKKQSPDKIAKKVKTIRYLLSELKAIIIDQDDSEAHRLIMELEDSISLLPTVIGSTNVQAEIALSLQPLRSENAQLRRRLRILNQQLRERERAEKDSRSVENNFEVISLQSMNTTLQAQLSESVKGLESLQKKNEELLTVIDKQREENKLLLKLVQGKEQDLFEKSQQCEMDTTRVKIEVGEALAKMRNIQLKLEASEKENQILEITLRQRDAEVNRLRELTRKLQGSMARLLSDLSIDCMKTKPTSRLTRNLLHEYENQLQDVPGLSPVTAYLKNLDNNAEYNTSTLSFCKVPESEPPAMRDPPSLTSANTGTCQSNVLSGKSSPRIFSRFDAQTACHITQGSEDSTLDETTYLPLVGNTTKQENESAERRKCIPLHLNSGSKKLHYDDGSSFGVEVVPCILDGLQKPEKPVPEEIPITQNLKEKTLVNDCASRMAETENKQIQLMHLDISINSPHTATDLPKSNLNPCTLRSDQRNRTLLYKDKFSAVDSSFSSADYKSIKSGWSISSISSFNSHDEQDFKNSLAALDANIARLQKSLQADLEINRCQNI